MPRADFFARFGFLQVRGFFDAETCKGLRAEVGMVSGTPGTIRGRDISEVDQRVRRVTWAQVSPATRAFVDRRLTGIKPHLERHFGVALSRHEDPSFLRYGPGDFYVPHHDREDHPDASVEVRARQVSVVAFLNTEGEPSDPEAYGGGALTFAGLLDDARLRAIGIPLVPEAGLLLAFRSDVLHSVTPVTHGERYTIVTWFA